MREKLNENQRKRYAANREKINENKRKRYAANKNTAHESGKNNKVVTKPAVQTDNIKTREEIEKQTKILLQRLEQIKQLDKTNKKMELAK